MKRAMVFASCLLAATCAQAAQVALAGTIVDKKGAPVANAEVKLVAAGLSTVTGAQGTFALNGIASVKFTDRIAQACGAAVRGHRVVFAVEANATPVTTSLYTCSGECVGGVQRSMLDRGTYDVDPFARICGRVAAQVYYFKLVRNNSALVLRLLMPASNGARSGVGGKPAAPALGKTLATVDSLLFSKPGFLTRSIPVSAYVAARAPDTLFQDTADATLFINNDTTGNHVMFFSINGNGQPSFYCRVTDDTGAVSYYATFEDGTGPIGGVVYSKGFIPVQWVLPGYNITVYNLDRNVAFDPRAAFHAMGPDTTQDEDTATLDIYPANIPALISAIETLGGLSLEPIRTFLSSQGITSFDTLAKRAQGTGPNNYLCMNAAFALSTMQAALALQAGGKLGKRQAAAGAEAAFKIVIQIAVRAGADLARKALGKNLDPQPAGIGILLCQGAAKYGVCHYRFFFCAPTPTGAVDPDAVNRCMNFCQVTLGCFTNICMPMDLSEATLGFGGGF
jgi:hypothetical protein